MKIRHHSSCGLVNSRPFLAVPFLCCAAKENTQRFDAAGKYWVVGVDIKQYDEQQPDHYLRGHWQWNRMEMNLSMKAYRNYFSIVASAPIDIMKFAQRVNEHRQKPPFNFTNPVGKMKGIVQVTTKDHGITKLRFPT